MKNIVYLSLIAFLYRSDCLLLKQIDKSTEISSFLNQNVLFPDNNDDVVIGVFLLNDISFEANDILTNWLSNNKISKISGIKIMNKIPRHINMSTFTDTMVFMDSINEHINDTLQTLLSESTLWNKEARYIFVLTKVCKENPTKFLHLFWTDLKLLNFVLIYLDALNRLQVLSYNPFKDEVHNFTRKENNTQVDLFPNKLRDMHGYSLNVSYWLPPTYVHLKEEDLKDTHLGFIVTFTKTLNASVRPIMKKDFYGMADEVFNGSGDLTGVGMFYLESGIKSYPFGILDTVVMVLRAKPFSAYATLLFMFDGFTWSFIVVVPLAFYGIKLCYSKLFSSSLKRGHPDISLKILIFAFAVFNIILTQTFQSWITTFLIYPKQAKNIDTIDELVESGLPVYTFENWKDFLTVKLKDQYVFDRKDSFATLMEGNETDGAFIITHDFVKRYITNKQRHAYHQVQEHVGTAYMVFYLSNNSPYRAALKDFTLRGLAYGFNSKEWGARVPAPLDTKREAKKLELGHFKGVFLLWTVGISLSILVFIAELLWYRYNRVSGVFEYVN